MKTGGQQERGHELGGGKGGRGFLGPFSREKGLRDSEALSDSRPLLIGDRH